MVFVVRFDLCLELACDLHKRRCFALVDDDGIGADSSVVFPFCSQIGHKKIPQAGRLRCLGDSS